MTSNKRPEQRSTAAERQPGQPKAQPTGGEVYSPGPQATEPERPQMTAEEQAELDELEQATAEAYEQLGRAADRLSERATDAYRSGQTFVKDNAVGTLLSSFVVGVILGVLISKK